MLLQHILITHETSNASWDKENPLSDCECYLWILILHAQAQGSLVWASIKPPDMAPVYA